MIAGFLPLFRLLTVFRNVITLLPRVDLPVLIFEKIELNQLALFVILFVIYIKHARSIIPIFPHMHLTLLIFYHPALQASYSAHPVP